MNTSEKKNSVRRKRRAGSAAQSQTKADGFRQTREAHSREIAEDYLETIADLVAEFGEARVTDLSRRLGVTHVTVNRTVARLCAAGHVHSQPYRSIFLTDSGKKIAAASKQRHETVVNFLRAIGVNEMAALRDAEGIEHHVSNETLAVFARFIKVKK